MKRVEQKDFCVEVFATTIQIRTNQPGTTKLVYRVSVHGFANRIWLVTRVHDCGGGHSSRETPGPIPNPEAKPARADGTAHAGVWESRKSPH